MIFRPSYVAVPRPSCTSRKHKPRGRHEVKNLHGHRENPVEKNSYKQTSAAGEKQCPAPENGVYLLRQPSPHPVRSSGSCVRCSRKMLGKNDEECDSPYARHTALDRKPFSLPVTE